MWSQIYWDYTYTEEQRTVKRYFFTLDFFLVAITYLVTFILSACLCPLFLMMDVDIIEDLQCCIIRTCYAWLGVSRWLCL